VVVGFIDEDEDEDEDEMEDEDMEDASVVVALL
jgi:hypothetical protein